MFEQNSIDLKIILAFTNYYQNLYEKGEISSSQLDDILLLLDKYQDYSLEDFKEKIRAIESE